MATTSFTAKRRFAGFAITLMLFTLWLSGQAMGQGTPLVTATSAVGLSHPTGWGAIQQTAIDSSGDWFVVDYGNGGLYEFPAGGGAAITLGATSPSASLGGGGQNPAIAIDPGNNLYLGANWNNCLVKFPWNPATGTWTGLNDGGANDLSPSNPTTTMCTNSGTNNEPEAWAQYSIQDLTGTGDIGNYGYFQPWGIAIGNNNNLIIGLQGGNNGIDVQSLAVTGGWSNPTVAGWNWVPAIGLSARAISIAQDPEGNVYLVEDSGGLPGVLEIPGTATNGQYQKVGSVAADATLARVDPNLPAVTGVVTDAAGNLYISDSQVGVVMVPNPSGTPQTSSAVLLTSVPAQGEVAIDRTRNVMYVPTKQTQTNGEADVAMVGFGSAELGSSAIGTATPEGANIVFSFNGSVTPKRAVILQGGATSRDFAISGGTCAMGTAYSAGTSCLETVAMTPHSVGSVSGTLLLQKTQAVPSGLAGAGANVTGWSVSSGVLTLTANNSFVAGQPVLFSGAATGSNLAPLNGQEFAVLPAGLSSSTFEISTSAVPPSGCSSNCTSGKDTINVTGEEYSTVASMLLHGTGLGSLMQVTPALESNIGGNLSLPSQVAVDAQGNVYVADAGLDKVLQYPAGSSVSSTPNSIGSNLAAPTGVAVDGAGDVFIADSGKGAVYEIPAIASLSAPEGQVTVVSGLGTNLSLAADGSGDLYVADPTNGRVVKLRNFNATGPLPLSETMLTVGFTAPSSVAVDSNGNLYIIDGANLFEMAGGFGAPVTLLKNLSGATGVAVDPSGAVYVTSAGGTMRIPNIGGALAPGNAASIASTVTSPAALAIDQLGNVYLADRVAENVHVVQVNGTLNFAPFTAPNQSASLASTVTNVGNAQLSVTGYSATNPTVDTVSLTDWTASDGTCVGNSPIAPGAICEVEVTLNPASGEQGQLTSQISLMGNSLDTPVIDATGVAASLAGTTTAVSVTSSAEVINTPVTVTVTPSSTSGTPPTPKGIVALTYPTWIVRAVSGVPTIIPQTQTVTATLDATGKATFALAPVLAGSDSFAVEYIGDRTYGRSTKTVTATVAKSAITGIGLPTFPDPTDIDLPFVAAGTGSGTVPYNGDETPFEYNFLMNVNTAAGVPTGTITVMDNATSCPPGTSATGVGAAACILAGYATPGGYSGVACPNQSGSGVLTIANAGTPTGAQASFPASCLWFVPQGISYSPVMFTHYIYPVYSGDANFLTFSGTKSTLIQSVRGPMVQITQSGNSASQTVAPTLTVQHGSTATVNLTLTSMLGYGISGENAQLNASNFPVSLSCDNLPPHTQCAFTYPTPDPTLPNAVDITCPSGATTTQIANGSAQCTPGQVTMTLYTDVSAGTAISKNVSAAPLTLAAIFGFGMFGLFFRRRAFEKGRMLLMVFLMVVGGALAVSITACNTTTLTAGSTLSTPTGTYQMTITADEVGTLCVSEPGGPGDNCIVPGSGSTTNNGILVYGTENQVSLPFYVNVTIQ